MYSELPAAKLPLSPFRSMIVGASLTGVTLIVSVAAALVAPPLSCSLKPIVA